MKRFFFKHPVLMIAFNSYMDARHSKVLHIAGFFAALLILFSLFMGEVSLYQNEKVVKDVGLAAISMLGVFIAIYLGVNSLYRDLERRTIYSIISKPIGRSEILFGKFLGICLVLISAVVMMSVYLYLVTSFIEAKIDFALFPAIGLMIAELLIIAAIAIFFSSFSSPFLSAFFSAGVFVIGRVSGDLADFGERSKNEVFKFFATSVQKIFDLESFDLRARAVHKIPIYAQDFWYPVMYASALIAILLVFSHLFFVRRDFK